ncbi:MAG: CoA ester lyase [Hyphomicrobiales bacterium]|nr:CoA ester lyase [Hyphomicrobiales bacterium]
MPVRPRRSVLYMPGNNARAIDKARTLSIDAAILDLEDSIAPEAKHDARERVRAAVAAGGFGSREVVVRINGLDTEWWLADVDMVHDVRPDALLVPKISQPVTLENLADRLMDIGADHRIKVWAMIETPAAILNARDIAAVAHDIETRLSCLVIGTNDLAREMRGRIVPGRAPMLPLLALAVAAARAHGIDILDGPFNDLDDADGFAAECAQARDLGFDGKTLIHPNQIAACNAAFTPSAEEIVQARAVLSAFERPENRGRGVIALEGRMVERLHAEIARRTVAIADAIVERGG